MARPQLFKKSARVTILLDARISAAYQQVATRNGTTASELMREALLNHLRLLARSKQVNSATADMVKRMESK